MKRDQGNISGIRLVGLWQVRTRDNFNCKNITIFYITGWAMLATVV